mgnify:CR=1 FL=1
MFSHNKRLQYTVRVSEPNPALASLLLEQFGGPDGELAAAMRYFTQGLAEDDPGRKDLLLDIATEELSHLEVIGSIVAMLNKGVKGDLAEAALEEAELYKSLTWDRGKELADHKRFSMKTDIDVYFCDPKSPWQRGSNENTNRLLRQYFPRGTDLSLYSQAIVSAVARQLNERPRKTLEYQTPAERFQACVATTR